VPGAKHRILGRTRIAHAAVTYTAGFEEGSELHTDVAMDLTVKAELERIGEVVERADCDRAIGRKLVKVGHIGQPQTRVGVESRAARKRPARIGTSAQLPIGESAFRRIRTGFGGNVSHAIPLNPHRSSGCGYFKLGLLT
jgi:hypothetical protein